MGTRDSVTNIRLPCFFHVDAAVAFAHRHLWRELRDRRVSDHVALLDPSILAEMLGLTYEVMPQIRLEDKVGGGTVVGLLDVGRRSILVSEERGLEVARYTGAHELGHWLYHQNKVKRHWEREFDPDTKDPQEREADQFAARFLMPRNLLIRRLAENFGQPPIQLDDRWLYFLLGDQPDLDPKDLDVEYALAKSHRSASNDQIIPLNQQFKVSPKAMAIRLQEIGAVVHPSTSYRTDL